MFLAFLGVPVAVAMAPPPRPVRGDPALLARAWRSYRRAFIQDDGRVIDHDDGAVTTSEGQAYALLQAVWMGDRRLFDRLLRWTLDNLQAGDPGRLPAWRWGRREDGSWGVLDAQPAADADILLAYALMLGARRWDDRALSHRALRLVGAVWREEVVQLGDRRVLLPGPWARSTLPVRVNPSYWFIPAFRAFARLDPEHPWDDLVAGTYAVLDALVGLDRLPPDWALLDPATGAPLPPPPGAEDLAVYGFEALRIPWNLAADALWHDDPRARVLLAEMAPLGTRWVREGALPAVMRLDGTPVDPAPCLAQLGALLPAFGLTRPEEARRLAEEELRPALHRWGGGRDRGRYYDRNWVWFGLALWQGVATPAVTPW